MPSAESKTYIITIEAKVSIRSVEEDAEDIDLPIQKPSKRRQETGNQLVDQNDEKRKPKPVSEKAYKYLHTLVLEAISKIENVRGVGESGYLVEIEKEYDDPKLDQNEQYRLAVEEFAEAGWQPVDAANLLVSRNQRWRSAIVLGMLDRHTASQYLYVIAQKLIEYYPESFPFEDQDKLLQEIELV